MGNSDTTIKFARFDSTLVVTILESQLRDLETSQRVKNSIIAELNDESIRSVILDLAAVEFVGSVAFLAFMSIRRQPTIDKIVLCHLRANVREVFTICRLLTSAKNPTAPFSEAESVATALSQLGQS